MFTTFLSLSLFITLIHTVLAQSGFSIDTPAFLQCQPAQITWSPSNNPPYDLLIVSAQDVCGEALEDLGNQTSIAMTWTVNLGSGTQVVLSLQDSVGNEAWSGAITVGSSNDTSCLASTPSSAPPSSYTVPPGNGATPAAASPSPTSSAFSPAGAANPGLAPTSGALSTRPISTITLLSSAVLAAAAFAL
ncbi:hypothetical protein J3R82DRAFT_11793 [Butyriboletus roseoflavus]|nr:hypothetical protein J3R82DRAFT_11793 [Butyriboletus roseoflavus]